MTPRVWVIGSVLIATAPLVIAAQVRDRVPLTTTLGSGEIAGVVVDDTMAPVRRARVALTRFDGDGPIAFSTTDAVGRFVFDEVPTGRYQLQSSKPAWLDGRYGARRPGAPGLSFQLAVGQHLGDLTIAMVRGGVISGTVTGRSGEPLPSADVTLYRDAAGWTSFDSAIDRAAVVAHARADDRGQYRFYGLLPGRYLLAGSWPGASTSITSSAAGGRRGEGYVPTFYPGIVDAAASQRIAVRTSEQRLDVDLPLLWLPRGRVTGTVVSRSVAAPTAIDVQLLPVRPGFEPSMAAAVRASGDGRFEFDDVAPGRYALLARAFVEPTGIGLRALATRTPVFGAADIGIQSGEVQQSIELMPASHLSGHVTFGPTSATSSDNGRALTFRLVPADAASARFGAALTTTVASAGSFRFDAVPPGRYHLVVPPSGRWFPESAMWQRTELLDNDISLRAGEDVDDVQVIFSDRPSTLEGVLRDGSGQPVADYCLVVFPADRALWGPRSRRMAQTRPDASGAFTFRGLPAGSYRLAVVTDLDPAQPLGESDYDQAIAGSVAVRISTGRTTVQDVRLAAR
jgi:protocatechuate 3,4-dioxygenase beta subunit